MKLSTTREAKESLSLSRNSPHAVTQLVDALRYKPEGHGFDSRWCHIPSGRTMALGWTQSLNRNEYQEYFLGLKAAGALGLQPYHLQVPTVLKYGSLNLLEPSQSVQASTGTVLPF